MEPFGLLLFATFELFLALVEHCEFSTGSTFESILLSENGGSSLSCNEDLSTHEALKSCLVLFRLNGR